MARSDDNRKLSEWIELHLELKAKAGELPAVDETEELDVPEAEGTLPPRSTLFPAKRRKWNKIFYNTLLVLFIMLVAGLALWGFRLNGAF